MSNDFLERNKKKGLLALLLLWLRRNPGLSALLLLVALSSFLFVAPAGMLIDLPGGTRLVAGIAWIASRIGVDTSKWGFFARGQRRSYDEFVALLRAAKEGGERPAGWGPFFGQAPGAGRGAGSSLDMVKGRRSDLEGGAYPGGKLPQGKEVAGILNPEDAEGEDAVNVDDLLARRRRGGLVRDAEAGGFVPGLRDLLGFAGRPDRYGRFGPNSYGGGAIGSGGTGSGRGPGSGGGPGSGSGPYAGSGLGGSGPGAGSRPGDNVRSALETTDPGSAPRSSFRSATGGRLSAGRAADISARVQRGVSSIGSGGSRAFAQLADGRGRAALATTPNCVPPGCPGEFQSYNTGAVYDGLRVSGGNTDLLSAPEIDGTMPAMPDTSVAEGYMAEATQLEADAKKCRELDDYYTPLENAASAKMQQESDKFESMGCGSGGCSESKAKRCEKQGDRIKAACREYASIRNAHTNECPLTRGKGAEMNCDDRSGPNDKGVQSQGGASAVGP